MYERSCCRCQDSQNGQGDCYKVNAHGKRDRAFDRFHGGIGKPLREYHIIEQQSDVSKSTISYISGKMYDNRIGGRLWIEDNEKQGKLYLMLSQNYLRLRAIPISRSRK